MQFGVLGRLEVFRADCTPVAISGPARRQVLAALLARAGSFVSAERLVDDLWGLAPPRSAIGSLRSHVARLRDDLGRDERVVVTEGNGYRLLIEPSALDATRFEELVDDAARQPGAEEAIHRYDTALGLWRDEAYLEFGDAPFAVEERIRLAELRSRAQEQRADLLLGLGRAGELVGELEQRVTQQPFRERGWEQLARALYADDRQADALDACRRARTVLAEDLGIEPGAALRDLEGRILRQDPALLVNTPPPSVAADTLRGRCPYLGLTGYDERDAAIFVGRERLTSVLAAQLADHSVVVVTGASGVGKSSLIRAGLLPALRAGAVPGSAAWRIHVRTPADPQAIADESRRCDLLVLDQAEELFTVSGSSTAENVLKEVSDHVTYGGGRLVLVLRSDFYGRLADVSQLAGLAGTAPVLISSMRADELQRAVLEPAAATGLHLEPDLVEAIMQDVAGQPEPLPLLSEAMMRTWQARTGDVLTLEGYRLSGGVAGALEVAAEDCFEHLDEPTRMAVRHLLVRMAAPSGSGGWVRRPLVVDEIAESGPDRAALVALVQARLAVVTDRRVEIAHDALLEHWPRLHGWLDERSVAADLLDHLGGAAATWRTAGRQPTDLYRGPRLAAALDWRDGHPLDLSPDEQDFLGASEREADAELNAAREQVAREADGRRRLRRIAVALLVVVVLALAGGGIALDERATAQRHSKQEAAAALTADANRISTLAATLPSDRRGLGLLLAAEGVELKSSDVSAGGLQAALMQVPSGLDELFAFPISVTMPHLDASSRLLAAPGSDGKVRVYDVHTGRLARTLSWSTPRQFAVFSGDDRFVAAGGSDGTVVVWDLSRGRPSGTPLDVGDGVVHPVFDPHDDNRVYVVSTHGGVSEWDLSDAGRPHVLARFVGLFASGSVGSAPDLTVSADGQRVAAGETPAGHAVIWDTATRRQVRAIDGASIGDFGPSGDTLPFGFGADTVLVDARDGHTTATVHDTGGAAYAVLSADGHRLAVPQTGVANDVVTVYDVATSKAPTATTVPDPLAVPLRFLPDGRLVVAAPNEAAIWRLDADLPKLAVRLDTSADRATQGAFEQQEPFFVTGQHDVLVDGLLYDGTTGRLKGPIFDGAVSRVLASSPNGRMLIAGTTTGALGIWDIATHKLLGELPGVAPLTADSAVAVHWSVDGRQVAADLGGSAPFVWDVSDARHPSAPRRVQVPASGVVDDVGFAMSDRRLVVLSAGSTRLTAVDLGSGRVAWTRTFGDGRVREWAIAPGGTMLSVDSGTDAAGKATVVNIADGRVSASAVLPTYGGIGYLNGGRWLVISSDQPAPEAQLYDATTLQPFGVPFPTGDSDVDPLATDPDGTRFAESIIYNSQAPVFPDPLVWNVDPAAWLRTACALAGRNLTHAEWQQYLPGRPYRITCAGLPAGD